MLVGEALSVTHELSFLFFFFIALSSHAVDGHQMYFGGSIVNKASIIDIEVPPPLAGGGSKSATFGVVFHITQI